MKAQERLFLIAYAVDFMTKTLPASGLAIFFQLQKYNNECGLKTNIDFYLRICLPENTFLHNSVSATI